jgi:excisionase family DNA binding protein
MNPEPNRITKRLYSIKEASAYLGRSEWSVRRLWNGILPAVRIGRRVHIDFFDLNAFIDRNKEKLAA